MPRRLGQHFLKDRSVLAKIAAALELSRADHVLEIGPGQGVLTRELAGPGAMSMLGVSTQLFTDPSIVMRVPPGAFNPPPKVDSAVVKLEVLSKPRVAIPSEDQFFRVVRAGFGTKRKQLANSIAHGLGVTKDKSSAALAQAGVDGTRRAEELTLEEWSRLAWAAEGAGMSGKA